MVKFGIEFVPDTSIRKIVEYSKLAESVGIDYIWITDHYNNRNPYAVLTAVALSTSKINLGLGVTNPYVVNPGWTASAIASIDEISSGRAVLGLGAGDKVTLSYIGIPQKSPLLAVEECVEVIRKLWRGESVKFKGKVFDFNGARLSYTPTREIPIFIGAQGPNMLKLAWKIGDGLLINASHPKDFELAIKEKESKNEKNKDIDIIAYTSFSCDNNAEEAKKKVMPVVAFITAGSSAQILQRHNIPVKDATKIVNAFSRGNFPEAFEAVTDEMVDAFSIYGKPGDCVEKIRALIKKGVTQLVIGSPIGPKKVNAVELIAREVISNFTE